MTNNQLKKAIMRRVYVISALRAASSPMAIKALAFAGVLVQSRAYFSVKHVLANSPSFAHVGETFGFFTNAFTATQRATQVLVLALLALGAWLLRDLFRRVFILSPMPS